MTFESMIDNNVVATNENANANPTVNEEALAVKVSYGDEIRRATVTEPAYVALRDLCAKLFELDPATTVLKYQDDDGDKITVSSDGEMQDAFRLAKEKKVLRLFVEVKAPAIPPPAEEAQPAPDAFPCGWRYPGGRGGMHGFHHRGFSFPPRGGHHGFPHGGMRGGMHGFPHHGPHGFPHHPPAHPFPHPHPGFGNFGPFAQPTPTPAPAECTEQVLPTQPGNPNVNYRAARTFGHGVFSPADAPMHPRAFYSPYARCAFKEHKKEMKEQLRMMKLNATTDEDRQAIKDFKEQIRSECKARWHEMKEEKKANKAEWKTEKDQWKEYKKDKKEYKKEDKKCEKNDRLVARHVADITIPDNSELPADTPVTKTWRLRNAGLLAWPADSQLIFISKRGDNLNGPERIPVGVVEPQQEVDVSVTFITPAEPGRYIGYYRMATGDGSKFGQRVWVSFIITGAPTAAADPTAPLVPATLLASPSLSPAPSAPAKAPDAADDVTMD